MNGHVGGQVLHIMSGAVIANVILPVAYLIE